jgi:hypothetical protein
MLQRTESVADFGRLPLKMTEDIERIAVRLGVEEGLVFVLTMKLDKVDRLLFQSSCSGEFTVDESAATALGRNLTAYQSLFAGVLEERLNSGGLFAGADEIARGTPAEKKTHCLDED